ncbi:MAG: SRPBCC family protein [Candidatus Binatia bacterium]
MRTVMLLPLLIVSAALAPPPSSKGPPACVACRVDFTRIRSSYSAAQWRALMQGQIVTSKTNHSQEDGAVQSSVEASAIIPYPAARVWDVLADFESRPDFTPGLKESHLVRVDGNRVWLAQRVRVLWVNIRYQIIGTVDPEKGLMTWVLDKNVAHDIDRSEGSWQLAPLPEGPRTLVRYQARVDTGQPVPGFIERFLVGRSLPKIVSGLRAEVARRAAATK